LTRRICSEGFQNDSSHVISSPFPELCSAHARHLFAWVTEDLAPKPRDIYDVTKIRAEEECARAAEAGLTSISLRMSRCFPESEDLMAISRRGWRLPSSIDRVYAIGKARRFLGYNPEHNFAGLFR
jgi:hypothetical protein